MPRIPRGATSSLIVHVLNRSNDRRTLFHHPSEYRAFIDLLREGTHRFRVPLYAFCVMPNHFHAVMHPENVSELSGLMQWWLTSHVRRHHGIHETSGHLWQGRFKSFPVQEDEHLLTVLRYVLLNPLRAGLGSDPFSWPWTSLRHPWLTSPWPLQPPRAIESWLMDAIPDSETEGIRNSIVRRAPFGDDAWRKEVAAAAGLASTLRPPGRPRTKHLRKSSLSPFWVTSAQP